MTNKPNNSWNRAKIPPAEGERRAQRGYRYQYDLAAAAIYVALNRGDLLWLGLADREAGNADDLVLGLADRIIGYQFRSSKFPEPFRLRTLLMSKEVEKSKESLLNHFINTWQYLRSTNPNTMIEIRLVTNDIPSTSDKLIDAGLAKHSAAFLEEFEQHPGRKLKEWRSTRWWPFIEELYKESGLDELVFEQFLQAFHLLTGFKADLMQFHRLSPQTDSLVKDIADLLPQLVADRRDKDRWTQEELLCELGWPGSTVPRHKHFFPVGSYVQRNIETEDALLRALLSFSSGYIALVGPPGVGKSTLLQTCVVAEADRRVVRYLAYVPGLGQGVGRSEADAFLEDLNTQLKNSGLLGLRFYNSTLIERRQEFVFLLQRASERYQQNCTRTLIVIDGLDHITQEEKPQRSLLAELPLPHSIPEGVVFILGTQRLDLQDLKPAVRHQAETSGRKIVVSFLKREAVHRMADKLGLDADVSRDQVFEVSRGHPLVTHYIIKALHEGDEQQRITILSGEMEFKDDINNVYESAWRSVKDDEKVSDVLRYLAHAEGSIPLELLAQVIPEQAIEQALKSAKHLLKESSQGWSVFHNSFRLFILRKPPQRLGKEDTEYSKQIYRKLAKLTRFAPLDVQQHWMELRYLARAQDHVAVLQLAQPIRFRQQLAEGRAVSELVGDIRLALVAASKIHDAVAVTRLLLVQDEIVRRSTVLEGTTKLATAWLAVGDRDKALAVAEEYPSQGYQVVDALLDADETTRAKELFEKLEPLQQILTGRSGTRDSETNQEQLFQWTRRVFRFRDFEQINQATDQLANATFIDFVRMDRQAAVAQLSARLRYETALAITANNPSANFSEIIEQLNLSIVLMPCLLVSAALQLYENGQNTKAQALLQQAVEHAHFLEVPNARRCHIALLAAKSGGNIQLAQIIFDGLKAPAISSIDSEIDINALAQMTRAMIEYAQLAALVKRPEAEAIPSKRAILQPLQQHASVIGNLLGRAQAAKGAVGEGEVLRITRMALSYLAQTRSGEGEEYFAIRQLIEAAPILGCALIEAATLCEKEEFRSVLVEFDRAFERIDRKNAIRPNLHREVAIAAYKGNGNASEASYRLERLVASLQEETPSEQVDGLATLAIAFAQVDNQTRARALLAQVSNETLGYALPPKKDPQHILWLDLLTHSNVTDPVHRGVRVAFLMRQVNGMMKTEGKSAAYRIAPALIMEAIMHDARTGSAVAYALSESGVVSWASMINALLLGMVKRRPDLTLICSITWCSLVLPYYIEPYYQERYVGEFIEAAVLAVAETDVEILIRTFCIAIETESQAQERSELLQKLQSAAHRRGYANIVLDEAFQRWIIESPPPRIPHTVRKYKEVTSLEELRDVLEKENDSDRSDYEISYAFQRLAPAAGFEAAREMFERWPTLQKDSRLRFLLVDLALDADCKDYAEQLITDYEANPNLDERATWTEWTGGSMQRYFRAQVKLNGPSVHPKAYELFINSLLSDREIFALVILEIADILPVIAEIPDWPKIWDGLAEQLAATREHALGHPLEIEEAKTSDEELIATIFCWAFAIPVSELQQHAQAGALQLTTNVYGKIIFHKLVDALLAGKDDLPAEALQLLLLDTQETLAKPMHEKVATLVNHPDYAVAEGASALSRRWGYAVPMTKSEPPSFYNFFLDSQEREFNPPTLIAEGSGAMLVEDALGWTSMFPELVEYLLRQGVTAAHIRLRSSMFINQWGGLETFGKTATEQLEVKLRHLKMWMTFWKPHVMVAARALRYVAGELRRAGMIKDWEVPRLLFRMGYPAPISPLAVLGSRPLFILRPTINETVCRGREAGEKWISGVNRDIVYRPKTKTGEEIVAEITRFEIRKARDASYTIERICAPFLDIKDATDFVDCFEALPKAVWANGFQALTNELALTIVRSFACGRWSRIPLYQLIICPNWLLQLGWRMHPSNQSIYLDRSGQVVANLVWWRDGGPLDVEEDAIWGEGVYLTVTPSGVKQLESANKELSLGYYACRKFKPAYEGKELSKLASSTYTAR